MARLPSVFSLAIMAGACGGSSNEASSLFIPFPTDAGAVADAPAPGDRTEPPDTGADAPSDLADAGDRDGGPAPTRYGTCGRTVHAAVCACDQSDTACVDDALGSSTACDGCIADAQATCCPSQSDALQSCARAAGCGDLTCAQARCPSQVRAFQTCIGTQWEQAEARMSGGCYEALVGCLGTFPVACGS